MPQRTTTQALRADTTSLMRGTARSVSTTAPKVNMSPTAEQLTAAIQGRPKERDCEADQLVQERKRSQHKLENLCSEISALKAEQDEARAERSSQIVALIES